MCNKQFEIGKTLEVYEKKASNKSTKVNWRGKRINTILCPHSPLLTQSPALFGGLYEINDQGNTIHPLSPTAAWRQTSHSPYSKKLFVFIQMRRHLNSTECGDCVLLFLLRQGQLRGIGWCFGGSWKGWGEVSTAQSVWLINSEPHTHWLDWWEPDTNWGI